MKKGSKADEVYLDLLKDVMENGVQKGDRTGTGTVSTFGRMIRFNMEDGFPLLTTKKMFTKGIITELLWFLSGSTNIRPLVLAGNNIWVGDAYENYLKNIGYSGMDVLTKVGFINMIIVNEEFADKWGELGPVYGKQWVSWGAGKVNQIDNAIDSLKNNPTSRRIMINAWNVEDIDDMVLPPCHFGFQLNTTELTHMERCHLSGGNSNTEYNNNIIQQKKHLDDYGIPTHKLSLMWSQRSVDSFLGLPFNIASYGFLLKMIAQQVNMIPHELIGSLGDTHIYNNHFDQVKEQISREPMELPVLELYNAKDIYSYQLEDFKMVNYNHHEAIKAELSN